mmetsp:Transcript_41945/g.47673  ORF Transcript_41945/g.47673 Transcript_41945/m.47673 type:complete len:91 (+) Transcript_41945:75-347(+)|eukprot:CAMPEP_0194131680 /NCGR_PEP_ID=MMETSP0152-20130528/2403_1 /TAXON_ID=1049557 /ORGANISM="Thalassiothrix antarctica, Strain L6-D1" /LENGTH=90 /DNA_ID=CAMNT_0038826541 /DNA_START=30 /DNA_END=302 /DNA_ORIENTATION=-
MNFRITTTFVLLLASLQITVGSLLRSKKDSNAELNSGVLNSKVQDLMNKIEVFRESSDPLTWDIETEEKFHMLEMRLYDMRDRISMRAEL